VSASGADGLSGEFPGSGPESGVINPIGNDGDARGRHPESGYDFAGGHSANGHNLILAPSERPSDNAAVEHPGPVVFSREVKRGEIVNRRNQGAWPRPKHSPVARHMQDIDSVAPQEVRKRRLMPKDVL
jgi:hypothetical protein